MALRGIPAHTPGPTFLAYSASGQKLITAGVNNSIRVFQTGSDDEPVSIDNCPEDNTAIVASDSFFIVGSEDGTVSKYSLKTNQFEELLVRCTLPVRDLALSPDSEWVAVASDELAVKVVKVRDMTVVRHLREQSRGNKHVSFDKKGTHIAVSCSDGIVYIYSLASDEPILVKKLEGLVQRLDTTVEASSRVSWHPNGTTFAAPTTAHDMQMVKGAGRWEIMKDSSFRDGHIGNITAAAWSPNGALLATAATDKRLIIWNTSDRTIITTNRDLPAPVLGLCWHPTLNLISFTTNDGELFICRDVVPSEKVSLLTAPLTSAQDSNAVPSTVPRPRRQGTPDSLDDLLNDDPTEEDMMMVDEDRMFVDDDDGAGYIDASAPGGAKRRRVEGRDDGHYSRHDTSKWDPLIHPSFQSGSTPWKGDRRYLCLNLLGAVWTLDQKTHHTVTVEFYDRELRRDFHFTDPFMWDNACLNEHGTLFSCPEVVSTTKKKKRKSKYDDEDDLFGVDELDNELEEEADDSAHPSMIYYRPHETWTSRKDWRTCLPKGENVTSIALSDSYIVATTTAGYVRVYSHFGIPIRVYRQKSGPAVTCAAWRDYVLTVGNGPMVDDGRGGAFQLLYTLENIKRDEVFQNEDIVGLVPGTRLKSVMFSDKGDPYIFDSNGVLLVLQHWRTTGQARWVPILDTKLVAQTASDRTYWPVAVAKDKFHCIILKGRANTHPYFPRPLLSDLDFHIPLSTPPSTRGGNSDQESDESTRLEQSFVQNSLFLSLLDDRVATMVSDEDDVAANEQAMDQVKLALEADKALLQLLALECRLGDDHSMKAFDIVCLFRDTTGRMLEAAEKVAVRFGRNVLADKIRELTEKKMEEENERRSRMNGF